MIPRTFVTHPFMPPLSEKASPAEKASQEAEALQLELRVFTVLERICQKIGAEGPKCFISYAWGNSLNEERVERLAFHLKLGGIQVHLDKWHNVGGTPIAGFTEYIRTVQKVIFVGTPEFQRKYKESKGVLAELEIPKLIERIQQQSDDATANVAIPVLFEGEPEQSIPEPIRTSRKGALVFVDFRSPRSYGEQLMALIHALYDTHIQTPQYEARKRVCSKGATKLLERARTDQQDLTQYSKDLGTLSSFIRTLKGQLTELKKRPLSSFQLGILSSTPKERYTGLLIQLHDHPEIQKHAGLQDALANLFEELSHDESPQLNPAQERTYSLVQKLLSNGKVATLVASSLLKLKTKQPSASAAKPAVAPPAPAQTTSPVAPATTTLPAIAFGAALWNKHFGDVGAEPPLPPNIEQILNGPCPIWTDKKVHETHLLVLVPQRVNGQPLNLRVLGEVVKKPLQGPATKYTYFNLGEYKDPDAPASHWVLLSRDVIPGSRSKPYSEQQRLVQRYAGYEVPNVLDATVAILMEHVRSGTRMYSDSPLTYTRCQEKFNSNWQLVVGGFSAAGLNFDDNYYGNGSDGVGVQRKF